MTMRRQLIWAVALVLSTVGFVSAQETTTGSITGEVVDAQGAPVPGATVTVTSPQGPKTFVTDSTGRFFAPYLTPGKYAVRVELSGFSPVEQKNIDVRLGQRIELAGLTLKVGGLEEVVEVVGSAPVVDTSSTTAGGVPRVCRVPGIAWAAAYGGTRISTALPGARATSSASRCLVSSRRSALSRPPARNRAVAAAASTGSAGRRRVGTEPG